jgi:hypothetical protein
MAWSREAAGGRASHEHPVHRRIGTPTAVLIIAAAVALAVLVFFFAQH